MEEQTTQATRKKGKWKDRQHKPPFTLLSDGHCVVCPSIYPSFWWLVLSVLPFTLLSGGLCCLFFDLPFFLMAIVLSVLQYNGIQKEG
jgi:hypothetical protein